MKETWPAFCQCEFEIPFPLCVFGLGGTPWVHFLDIHNVKKIHMEQTSGHWSTARNEDQQWPLRQTTRQPPINRSLCCMIRFTWHLIFFLAKTSWMVLCRSGGRTRRGPAIGAALRPTFVPPRRAAPRQPRPAPHNITTYNIL